MTTDIYLFAKVTIVSTVDVGVLKTWIHIRTESGNPYKAAAMSDLSEWQLIEEFYDERFQISNSRR